jgi:hypothetical protein
MNACVFNVFHDCRHKRIAAVSKGIRLAFDGIIQKAIDENRRFL